MAGINFTEKVEEYASSLGSLEHMLGSGLNQPFSNTNAGAECVPAY